MKFNFALVQNAICKLVNAFSVDITPPTIFTLSYRIIRMVVFCLFEFPLCLARNKNGDEDSLNSDPPG